MRLLMIGDVIGRPGRRALQSFLPALHSEYNVNFVIANGENSASGLGITLSTARELIDLGVDVITTGNHVWARKEIFPYLDDELPIIRPLNYPPTAPGRGFISVGNVTVVNLIGRIFMKEADCPFRTMDSFLEQRKTKNRIIVVDFHAEATSEKMAMGRYLDGKVSAVLGTHTHVGTIDTFILPNGTAYVTDVGMVGPINSVIGDNPDTVLNSFLTGMPHRLSVGDGRSSFSAVLVDIDEATGKATNIKRIYREEPE